MSANHLTSSASATSRPMLRRLIASVSHWFARRQQRAVLEELDDALLRDIGLTPEEVRSECAKLF